MENEKLIILILSSSFLSAGLTGLISWLIKQNEYKKEINKRFINKRLDAYQDLELMIRSMYWVIGDKEKGYKYHLFLMDSKKYVDFLVGFGRSMHAKMWFSRKIRKTLTEINAFVLYNSDFMPLEPEKTFLNNDFVTEERILKAVGFYETIDNFKIELEDQMFLDYSQMHKVSLRKLLKGNKHKIRTTHQFWQVRNI